jgi:serine protease Do
MKSNTIIISIITALITAITTVFAVRAFEGPPQISIKDINNAKNVSYTDAMLGGKFQRSFISASPTNFTAAAELITPSVVNIKALTSDSKEYWNDGIVGASSGSGVIISSDGYIVTNNHVIENSNDIQVTLNDKRDYPARVVGTDPSTDLAVLKIEAQKLIPVRFGNSDSVRVGEWVLAVGNPFNLESTVTAGIISAKGRNINILDDKSSIESFIQTDAAVNPGNSGGALVNTNGELIGINTAIITKSGRYEGYSFSIPVNLAMKIIKDLKDFGLVKRGFLGVTVDELTPERAKASGLTSITGAYISNVNDGTAAADAGLKQGDVIIGVNNIKINTKPELLELIARFRPGNIVSIQFIRGGKTYKTDVTLKNKNNTTALIEGTKTEINAFEKIGILELRTMTDKEVKKVGKKGIKVIKIDKGSKIDKSNMEIGFIITQINDTKIDNVDQAIKLIAKTTGKVTLEGLYENFSDPYFYTFSK